MFDVSSIYSYCMTLTNSEILHHSLKSRSFNVFKDWLSTYSRTCCVKLKLSRKLSSNHSWTVAVQLILSNDEYALRNSISRYFHWKINHSQLNETAHNKFAISLKLTAKFKCNTPNSFRKIDISFQRVNKWLQGTCLSNTSQQLNTNSIIK